MHRRHVINCLVNRVNISGTPKKSGPLCFTAYNFRNIEQIFTKFDRNHGLFILNIKP